MTRREQREELERLATSLADATTIFVMAPLGEKTEQARPGLYRAKKAFRAALLRALPDEEKS